VLGKRVIEGGILHPRPQRFQVRVEKCIAIKPGGNPETAQQGARSIPELANLRRKTCTVEPIERIEFKPTGFEAFGVCPCWITPATDGVKIVQLAWRVFKVLLGKLGAGGGIATLFSNRFFQADNAMV